MRDPEISRRRFLGEACAAVGALGVAALVSGCTEQEPAPSTSEDIAEGRGTPGSGGEAFILQSPGKRWSYRATTSPEGMSCRRFELRGRDQWQNDVDLFDDGRQRVALRGTTGWPIKTDVWFAYSLRWSGALPGTWSQLTSFHSALEPREVRGKPDPFSFSVARGRFTISTRSDTRLLTRSKADTVARYSMPMFPADTWQQIVVRIRFDPSGRGRLVFWLNGRQRYDSGPIPIGYNDEGGPYFKFGLYRSASDRRTVAEFANVEIGTDSLLDRVSEPPPLPTCDPGGKG